MTMSKLGQKTRKIMAFIFAFVMIFSICSVTNEKNAKAEVEKSKRMLEIALALRFKYK